MVESIKQPPRAMLMISSLWVITFIIEEWPVTEFHSLSIRHLTKKVSAYFHLLSKVQKAPSTNQESVSLLSHFA